MTTTYILAGGADVKNPKYWVALREVSKRSQSLHVLSCQFAQTEQEWQERFESFKPYFKEAFGDDVVTELAKPDKIVDQVRHSDVIYLHGGDVKKLRGFLDKIPNLKELFKGKIVIGSSAGALFLSKTYWSCGDRKVGHGKGLASCYPIVHYGSEFGSNDLRGPIDWELAKTELRKAIGRECSPFARG